ncbi:ABC transporter substrate-binding protein [Kiloniella laminariae]|uniref:ABC transporter substrate-binding protein n=1 Tax=Kiloniella laminariae TaxID=454162 RepID=UPI001B7F94C0|nr:ABC transporter substrate-binding protein [Kiloniella laminariae]
MALLMFPLLQAPPVQASVPESPEPLRLILNDWTSQLVMTRILGEVYKSHGYKVEYKLVSTKDQWARLHRGLEHVQVEVWEGTMAHDLEKIKIHGQVIEAGDHSAKTREEWWYPEYAEELCPGLPDWTALRDCASLFASRDTKPKGRYIAGPWEKPEHARIRALNMDFVLTPAKTADELWVELARASKIKQPIVLFNWSPNWIESRYPGKFVEFPDYAPQCETDPSWGINPERPYDCGNPKDGWLKKIAWHKMPMTWPCAYAILQDMDFNNAMISEVAALVDADGLTDKQAAEKWLGENRAVWQSWGETSCE